MTETLVFTAPGSGSWELDRTHWTRPLTRLFASLYPAPFARGFSESGRRYGLLVLCPQIELVNGFVYTQVLPAPEHEIPERLSRAARAFETKLWREDLRRWDEEVKPASIRAHRALQQVDPRSLDGAALLDHVDACRVHLERMFEQHQEFIAAALVPTGDFLVRGAELAALPPERLLRLLGGCSPVSMGAEDGLDTLAEALRRDAGARGLLESDAPAPELLALLLRQPGAVGEGVRAYLDAVECRPLDGFELSAPCGSELPEILVEAIRGAVERTGRAPAGEDLERIRTGMPESRRRLFDELLSEARATYRLRDERSVYSDVWAMGLMRRAVLAAGARLAEAGRIDAPEHLLEATYADVVLLLRRRGGPDARELAERTRFRNTHTVDDAPRFLGDPPGPPPPLDGLPEPAARAMRAVGCCLQLVFSESDAHPSASVVQGLAASPGVYEGTVRLLAGPEELGRLRRGDVLVTRTTSEAFNVALPLVGAIVTDAGGLLSHAAIVAREYGIPGVVGTKVATQRLPDGARVRVDGSSGRVELLP